jgi:hypothetical protein
LNGLPVAACVLETWGELRKKWLALVTALFLPAVALSAIETTHLGLSDAFPYNLFLWCVTAPFYTLFAVICHRIVILGPGSLPNAFGIFWSRRETGFLGWTILIIVLNWGFALLAALLYFAIPTHVLGMRIPWFPVAVLLITGYYLYMRISMILPATAVDQATSLVDAWYLTLGNGIRLMLVTLLSTLPFVLVVVGLVCLVPNSGGLPFAIISEIFQDLIIVAVICSISVAYRTLTSIDSLRDDFQTSF